MPSISSPLLLPIHTPVTSVGVNPTEYTSLRLSVVPVLSPAGRPMFVKPPKMKSRSGWVVSFRMSTIT